MAGSMAGTALLGAPKRASQLHTISLTINNSCNLRCPHCYLQCEPLPKMNFISEDTLTALFRSPARHICIVGKEPLSDTRSIKTVERIVRMAADCGMTTSLITNGIRLPALSKEALNRLSWIDVSLDGGQRSYRKTRGIDIQMVLDGISSVRSKAATPIRVLHTITCDNVGSIDDMVEVASQISPEFTMFSPFQATRSFGDQPAKMVEPALYLERVSAGVGCSLSSHLISIDASYLSHWPLDAADFIQRWSSRLGNRLLYVAEDPVVRGMLRVTYDGRVMSPFDSINTRDYAVADQLGVSDLGAHFLRLLFRDNAWYH